MAGLGGIHPGSAAVAAALACGVGLHAASPAAAEERTQVLPDGGSMATAVIDLDGDGSAEVARLIEDPGGGMVAEVWRLEGTEWTQLRRVAIRDDLDERAAAGPGSELGMLLPWGHAGSERLLVVTAAFDPVDEFNTVCCLTIRELSIRDGQARLAEMPSPRLGADQVRPVDLDGDGSQELAMLRTIWSETGTGTTTVHVARWDGREWNVEYELERENAAYNLVVAESEPGRGQEIVLGFDADGSLLRLVRDGAEIVAEESPVDGISPTAGAWAYGAIRDRILVTSEQGAHLVRWPRDEDAHVAASIESQEWPTIQPIGDEDHAIVLVSPPPDPLGQPPHRLEVRDLDLRYLGTVEFSPTVARAWDVAFGSTGGIWSGDGRPLFPYVGPVPDGGAYIAGGHWITATRDGFASTPMAAMVGVQPLGLAGPDGSWMVLGNGGFGPIAGEFFLRGSFPNGAGRITLVPLDELLVPDPAEPVASIELRGAVELEREGIEARLAAEGDGFTAVVSGAPGTSVLVVDRVPLTWDIADEPVEISVRPRQGGEENAAFERWLVLVGPTGHASLVHWRGTFIREPPTVSATTETRPLELAATVRGRASADATVSVDGRVVRTGPSGAFEFVVDAPIWPRNLVVVARDPLGNEATQRVQVVGFVDYRGLPWVAIAAAVTVAVGAAMFLRVPGRRPAALVADGDGQLEEIDGDLR